MNRSDLPAGFVLALAQNESAIKQFESLSDEKKNALIDKTHQVKSKKEMRSLVDNLCDGSLNL